MEVRIPDASLKPHRNRNWRPGKPPAAEDLERIRELIPRCREIAQEVGPLHALWEAIFDGEALLVGKTPLFLPGSAEDVAKQVRELLEQGTAE